MFAPRDYVIACHGCGNIRSERTAFLSAALSLGATRGDKTYCVPALACDDCKAIPGRIRSAFDNGPSADARATFDAQLDGWLTRIEGDR